MTQTLEGERHQVTGASGRLDGRPSYTRALGRRAGIGSALAGQTLVEVDGEQPWRAGQGDTSMAAGHRGHRLGRWLKLAMLRLLAEALEWQRHL